MANVSKRQNRKSEIVAATERLLSERGLAGVTTRAIADAVPCSEGAIYVHFRDRLELLLAVLQASLPEMLVPLHALQEKVGKGTAQQNLTTALQGLMKFHDRVAPMLCALVSEPELRARFQESLEAEGKGPHLGIATLSRYIESEQRAGRIEEAIDAKTAASVLMSSSFFQIFTSKILGRTDKWSPKGLVDFVLRKP